MKTTLDIVSIKLDLLERLSKDENEVDAISNFKNYVFSSQRIANELITWNESLILGTEAYTKMINLHIDFIIASMHEDLQNKHISVVNKTKDLSELFCSGPLLKIILRKLLQYCVKWTKRGRDLEVGSYTESGSLTIFIIMYELEDKLSLSMNREWVYDEENLEFNIWVPCYQLLKFYQGNLWKEEIEQGRLKVSFSLPLRKIS